MDLKYIKYVLENRDMKPHVQENYLGFHSTTHLQMQERCPVLPLQKLALNSFLSTPETGMASSNSIHQSVHHKIHMTLEESSKLIINFHA